MSEVDQVNNAEGEGQPQSNQRIEPTQGQSIEQMFEEDLKL